MEVESATATTAKPEADGLVNGRDLGGPMGTALLAFFTLYAAWHLWTLNVFPMETWTYRLVHIGGALALGFASVSAVARQPAPLAPLNRLLDALAYPAAMMVAWSLFCLGVAASYPLLAAAETPAWPLALFGQPLLAGTVMAIVIGWLGTASNDRIPLADWVLIGASLAVAGFLIYSLDHLSLRLRAGTGFADPQNAWAAAAGVALILELTRRVAGMALLGIVLLMILYAFIGPWLPGFLEHSGYTASRFFTYLFTDNGILGPTIAVSSTYLILFIVFAAFLQVTKVGDYFVNFAFAIAGRARGGPAKVAVFASALMGTINGTSAGNVAATGSLTIPMMKRVGYRPQSAAAIEAAASTGGQIMPPIMGAGAFIMAEVTGIPYTEIVIAAVIPAILYFVSIYFMVDFEAVRNGMKGLSADELPKFRKLITQIYLFVPVFILIYALFAGYSVIRAGTLAIVAAAVVSWLTPHRMGPRQLIEALALGSRMALQIIAVCAAAGVIVGVIALTGVGARFSSLLLNLAQHSQLMALIFAMAISILLGMGMPTTAAYAVAASVVAPGLIRLGIEPLIAHFFVFYFAVISAITPPVALAAYAGSAIAGSDPLRTSIASFKIGIAAFIVPFMFFYSPGLLLEGEPLIIVRSVLTALAGVTLLAASIQAWFFGPATIVVRAILLLAALCMISGEWRTDFVGIGLAGGAFLLQRWSAARSTTAAPAAAAIPGQPEPSSNRD